MKLHIRISLAAAVILMLAVGGLIFLQNPPSQSPFYPGCHLHQLTGLFCPGCGSTRCLHALIQGEFEEAARKNMIAFAVLPLVGAYALFWGFNWVLGNPVAWRYRISPRMGVFLVAILITFGILRNLPWHPFTLLAPQ